MGQVRGVLSGRSAEQLYETVIAYEHVWAMGTGRTATGAGANDVVGLIRKTTGELVGQASADELRILYGGSVSPKNIAEFMSQPEIDGALVGGVSLKAQDFVAILRETARIKGG